MPLRLSLKEAKPDSTLVGNLRLEPALGACQETSVSGVSRPRLEREPGYGEFRDAWEKHPSSMRDRKHLFLPHTPMRRTLSHSSYQSRATQASENSSGEAPTRFRSGRWRPRRCRSLIGILICRAPKPLRDFPCLQMGTALGIRGRRSRSGIPQQNSRRIPF